MSHSLALPELVEAPPADDPYRYGFRMARCQQPDGSYEVLRLPLTFWDLLHPQMDDKIVQSTRHRKEFQNLTDVIGARIARDPHALVLSNWGSTGTRLG